MNIDSIDFENLQGVPFATKYDLYLTNDVILEGKDYNNFITLCSQLGEHDVVNLTISCFGGRVSTAALLCSAIENSKATFIAHLNGVVWSAATQVALACDGWVVGDLVEWGMHSIQGGTGYDELQKVITRAATLEKLNNVWDNKYYIDFLSEQELQLIKNGAEITMFKPELEERLKHYADKRQEVLLQPDTLENVDLSQFSSEELQEELEACTSDAKTIRAELKKRSSEQ